MKAVLLVPSRMLADGPRSEKAIDQSSDSSSISIWSSPSSHSTVTSTLRSSLSKLTSTSSGPAFSSSTDQPIVGDALLKWTPPAPYDTETVPAFVSITLLFGDCVGDVFGAVEVLVAGELVAVVGSVDVDVVAVVLDVEVGSLTVLVVASGTVVVSPVPSVLDVLRPEAITRGAEGVSVVSCSVAWTTCHAANEKRMVIATHAARAPNRTTRILSSPAVFRRLIKGLRFPKECCCRAACPFLEATAWPEFS